MLTATCRIVLTAPCIIALTLTRSIVLTPVLIAAVIGYLLGSLPFGYLVARAKGVNIFEVGSKNPGATNVRRVLGSGPGNLVLFLDALKGAVASGTPLLWYWFRTGSISHEAEVVAIAGVVAALLGHSFSCFTHFKGGKGVATGAGGFLVVFPVGMLIAIAVWCLTAFTTRYVSLASMLGAVSLPVTTVIMQRSIVLVTVTAIIALFVIFRHRANISRLFAGTESKIGQKAAAAPVSTAAPKT
ncbi:MAG: glycerol-3-phosphate 1-O-acyltransferase PlsY [Opitutaceae bacterium]